ncbi:MAG: TraR/DksA C4-type zinc finger protein [Bacteroidota bacterium]
MEQLNKEEVKRRIAEEITKTEDAVQRYEETVEPVSPDDAIGRVSRMDAIVNKSVVEAALRQAQRKLAKLKVMQSKLEEPNFGLCSRCNNPIPVQRLILMPQSELCVRCASR